jgi:hypothetical protein
MANKKRKIGQCVHCGRTDYISDDHLPPQSLFPAPRPNNLITVPSCDGCNGGSSKDDEYFRLWLVSRENTKGHLARDVAGEGNCKGGDPRKSFDLINSSALMNRQRRDIVNNKDRQRFTAISHRDLVPRQRTYVQTRLLRHFFGDN